MTIKFDILDSEADTIAAYNGYDPAVNGSQDAFVLEVFKQAGRVCLVGHENSKALKIAEAAKDAAVELAKSEISF